ncbi:MAG TPA: acyl-CoA dehydrogenase family protein [Acidimicrobiales bacterium]|nr:acyl-CoA dehydrogenase family protein [Acidimicrobiales bacterium]
MSMIDVAREMAPVFSARAADGEAERTMPADLVALARAAGLFGIAVPRSLGGLELDPRTVLGVVEEISRADGSAGWTVLIGNATAFFAWLDPAATKEMLGDEPGAVSTGVFAPSGRAVPAGDGHLMLDGRWSFNSGCVHADWFQTGFMVMDGDEPARRPDGRPDWRFAYYRREQAEVIDTWRSTGLRGTGSHDVAVRGLRIPEAHTAMPFHDPPRHQSDLLELGFSAFTAVLLAGFPLGVARRALDEIVALAPTKRRPHLDGTVADDRQAQLAIGRAEARLQSARAFVHDAFGRAWCTIGAGSPATPRERGTILLATQHAMEAAVHAVDAAHLLAGSTAVADDHPLARCHRDILTARQHVVFSGERFAEYARERLGLAA